jgi:hypothetical protein
MLLGTTTNLPGVRFATTKPIGGFVTRSERCRSKELRASRGLAAIIVLVLVVVLVLDLGALRMV